MPKSAKEAATEQIIDMERRMMVALLRTYQTIGTDLWPEETPSSEVLREVVPDGNSLEMYGHDEDAVKAFRALSPEANKALLKKLWP